MWFSSALPMKADRDDWTAFEQAVADVLDRLQPGDVVTYGEVAAEAGFPGAARAVGSMLRRAGEGRLGESEFCWWRVVAASGRLLAGHHVEQARRLALEGVEVREGRIVG